MSHTETTDSNKISVTIEAWSGDYCMGKNLVLTVEPDAPLSVLAAKISRAKSGRIRPPSMRFSVVRSPAHRLIERNAWEWGLHRHGICDGSVLAVEPEPVGDCPTGSWEWHTAEYYVERHVEAITEALGLPGGPGASLEKLEGMAPFPPPMAGRTGYLPFLRRYPELFYVEAHTDTGYVHVERNVNGRPPAWF